jgi:hypothetical protein
MFTHLLLTVASLSSLATPALPGPVSPRPAQTHPLPKAKPRARGTAAASTYGAKADSLDGIPAHRFGEPRSNFPELEARGYPDPLTGLVSYSLREGSPAPGWFAKNADQVSSTYWFYHDQFAALTAHARNQGRQLLADEVTYLFGPGQLQGTAFGQTTHRWRGQRVLVEVANTLNETTLSISSLPSQAQQMADQRAKQQAEAATRAAKFKADNAPPVRPTP